MLVPIRERKQYTQNSVKSYRRYSLTAHFSWQIYAEWIKPFCNDH